MTSAEREAAILQALDEVLAATITLGNAVGKAITAMTTLPEPTSQPNVHDYERLKHMICGTCNRPAFPHPYRHPVTVNLPGRAREAI